jgi:hypothetical protein
VPLGGRNTSRRRRRVNSQNSSALFGSDNFIDDASSPAPTQKCIINFEGKDSAVGIKYIIDLHREIIAGETPDRIPCGFRSGTRQSLLRRARLRRDTNS